LRADLSRALDGQPQLPWGRWVDVKVDLPDVLCGSSTRGTGLDPAMVAMILPRLPPRVQAVLQALVPGMASTPPQELLLLDDASGAYHDLRRPLAGATEDTLRLGVLDAGDGHLRIARYLTPPGAEYDQCASCQVISSDVSLAGRARGHGLTVHLDRFPDPGTEVRLTCGGRTQTWRYWPAGRRGSYADFAHFGCGAATRYDRLEVVRGGETATYPAGALDRALRCDAQACVPVAPRPAGG
jgi:hypothetical protein